MLRRAGLGGSGVQNKVWIAGLQGSEEGRRDEIISRDFSSRAVDDWKFGRVITLFMVTWFCGNIRSAIHASRADPSAAAYWSTSLMKKFVGHFKNTAIDLQILPGETVFWRTSCHSDVAQECPHANRFTSTMDANVLSFGTADDRLPKSAL